MLKGLIANRLKTEFAYYDLVEDLMIFREKRCVREVLYCIYEEELVFNFSKNVFLKKIFILKG